MRTLLLVIATPGLWLWMAAPTGLGAGFDPLPIRSENTLPASDADSSAPGETAQTTPEIPHGPILLADDSVIPSVTVRWRADGRVVEHRVEVPFGPPDRGQPLPGTGLGVSVSLGGVRLESGAGHPKGAILRVGLLKENPRKALFRGVDPGSSVVIEARGVRFNQPVRVEGRTVLVRLLYALADIKACSLPDDARTQYLTADPDESLGGWLRPGVNATLGALTSRDREQAVSGGFTSRDREGAVPAGGSSSATVEPDGTVTFRVVAPYAMLRHLQDPWSSTLPGTFFEPVRIHAEVEVLPAWADAPAPSGADAADPRADGPLPATSPASPASPTSPASPSSRD